MEAAATRALAWREFVDSRVRNVSFALFFGLYAYGNAAAYDSTYPTLADRMQFAQSFGDNKALRVFYGVPKDLLTSGGYTEWRVGGVLQLIAAVLGLVAAVKVFGPRRTRAATSCCCRARSAAGAPSGPASWRYSRGRPRSAR